LLFTAASSDSVIMPGLQSRRCLTLGNLSMAKRSFTLPGASMRDYDIQELLGFGSAGKVFKAKQKQDNKEVALKVMQCLDEEMLRIRCGEFNVLRTLRHPHIVNVLNFWTHDNEAVLAMELHSQSNLQQVVRKASSVDEMTSKHLFKMLLEAVDFLHQQRIIHRDVKPENILVSDDLSNLWLADFNAAHSLLEGGALSMTFTAEFASPEVLAGKSHAEPADVWSCGLCLHFMLRGDLPRRLSKYSSRNSFMDAVISQPVQCDAPGWATFSSECREIVKESLCVDSGLRPSAAELLSRSWVGTDPPSADEDTWTL